MYREDNIRMKHKKLVLMGIELLQPGIGPDIVDCVVRLLNIICHTNHSW